MIKDIIFKGVFYTQAAGFSLYGMAFSCSSRKDGSDINNLVVPDYTMHNV